MPEWLRLALAGLAAYRAAQLVSIDDGPFDLLLRLRLRAGVYDRGSDGQPRSALGRLVACPYCTGPYFAILFAALALLAAPWSDAVLAVAGVAGAQAYLQGPRKPR